KLPDERRERSRQIEIVWPFVDVLRDLAPVIKMLNNGVGMVTLTSVLTIVTDGPVVDANTGRHLYARNLVPIPLLIQPDPTDESTQTLAVVASLPPSTNCDHCASKKRETVSVGALFLLVKDLLGNITTGNAVLVGQVYLIDVNGLVATD